MITTYTRIRTIDLVLVDLCAHPVGTLLEETRRKIGDRIGRSAGAITPALKRLAADGWISYLSDGRSTLIEVLRTDQESDRSVLPTTHPAAAETAPASAEPPPPSDQAPDRENTVLGCDQTHDRLACMDDHESLSQEEESARAPVFEMTSDPLYQRLMAEPHMNSKLAARIAKNPPGTVADFAVDLALAQRFAKQPFYFCAACWRDGQRVIAPQESSDERPVERPAPAAGAGRRSAPNAAQRLPGSPSASRRPKPYVTGATERSIARALGGAD